MDATKTTLIKRLLNARTDSDHSDTNTILNVYRKLDSGGVDAWSKIPVDSRNKFLTFIGVMINQILNSKIAMQQAIKGLKTEEEQIDESTSDFPNTILLRRKLVRSFGPGDEVGLYVGDKLNTKIAIPGSFLADYEVSADNITENINIVAPQFETIELQDGTKQRIDEESSRKITMMLEEISSDKLKDKYISWMTENRINFQKARDFAYKITKELN